MTDECPTQHPLIRPLTGKEQTTNMTEKWRIYNMTTYNIGYFNRPWANSEFVIQAITHSKWVARHIMESYNEGRKGDSYTRATILTDAELPQKFRFAMDEDY